MGRHWTGLVRSMLVVVVAIVAIQTGLGQVVKTTFGPGDVFREYRRPIPDGNYGDSYNWYWRIINENVSPSRYPVGTYLPSYFPELPQLQYGSFDLDQAVRAEVTINVWGGHIATTDKQIRFNGGTWVTVPELGASNGIPSGGHGQCYMNMPTVTVEIPLEDLVDGNNYFQGRSGVQDASTCGTSWSDFGQWGWYGIIVRIYYNPSTKTGYPTGQITSPAGGATLDENPTVTATASGGGGINSVEFLAYYEGYDEDGDGVFQDYHYDFWNAFAQSLKMRNNVGTATSSPYSVVWDTYWVPDQAPRSVKLMARIEGANGLWYVTDEVQNLSLRRTSSSVKLYTSNDVPINFQISRDHTMSCTIDIPSLTDVQGALLQIRSWNGANADGEPPDPNYYVRLNSWDAPAFGVPTYYSFDELSVPVNKLVTGSNTFEVYVQTTHHGLEIHWPGPGLTVRYGSGGTILAAYDLRFQDMFLGDTTGHAVKVQMRVTDGPVRLGTSHLVFSHPTWLKNPVIESRLGFSGDLYSTMGLSTPAPGLVSLDIGYIGDPGSGTQVGTGWVDVAIVGFGVSGVAGSGSLSWMSDSCDVREDNNSTGVGAGVLEDLTPALGTQLGSLSAAAESPTAVRVSWTTMQEYRNLGFEVQRSSNGSSGFATLSGSSVAGHGTVTGVHSYSYLDTTVVGGPWYYRLRQIDSGSVNVRTSGVVKATGTVGVENKEITTAIPEGYRLEQNYPNPFNPTTVIGYQIAKSGEIRLAVFDVLGREVAVLVSGNKAAGRYTARFDATGMPSGIYIYRLTSQDGSLQQKMLLVK